MHDRCFQRLGLTTAVWMDKIMIQQRRSIGVSIPRKFLVDALNDKFRIPNDIKCIKPEKGVLSTGVGIVPPVAMGLL